MASVKKHFSQQINRLNQAFSQSIGRSEKSDVLAGDLQTIDQRVECMINGLKHTRKKLAECLRSKKSGSTKEDLDKRRNAFDEYKLAQVVQSEAKDLDAIFPGSLLSDVMIQYSDTLSFLVQDMAKAEIHIESNVLEKLAKFSEELENISQQKDKLKKLVLDMDSARSRLSAAQSRSDEKVNEIQDEFDSAYTKVENCKDAFAVDLYTLASKEIEMAGLYRTLLQIQIDYHRSALERLEMAEPIIGRRIDTYFRRPVYSLPLDDHLQYSEREIALVLEVCCRTLLELGLKDEGLFRISGNATKVRKLKAAFDAGEIELSDSDRDPHSIAGALKSYLRELPDPLMCSRLYDDWLNIMNISDPAARLLAVQDTISKLPMSNYANLRYLIKFLAKLLDNQAYTKMSSQNLAIVMAPNIIWNPSEGDGFGLSTAHGALVELLLTNANYLFPGDIPFSAAPINSGNGFDNHVTARHNPLSVDVSFRGSRGASNDSLNADQQSSPAKGASRKSKPPPPPPVPSNPLSPRSNAGARASFHGTKSERAVPFKAVDVGDNQSLSSFRLAAAEQLAGHKKSSSLDRPVRPPVIRGAEPQRAAEARDPVDQLSISASELVGHTLKQSDSGDTEKSATLPRPQPRSLPPPIPNKVGIFPQRPGNLDVLEAFVEPTTVRISMSDDSDTDEPVVVKTGGAGDGQRSTAAQRNNGIVRRSIEALGDSFSPAPLLAPQPMPRRHPTSPKEVSYVSVAEESENSSPQPVITPNSPSGDTNTLQQQENASASTPVRPKPPIPSKPRIQESPDNESIVRF